MTFSWLTSDFAIYWVSHWAMNRTDMALVTGHLEGRIGWHFTLKRKVSPKNNFLHCVGLPITNYSPLQIFIYSLALMVVPPLPTIQHISMSNSLPPSSSCRWPNSFVAMSHGHPDFKHPSHLFEAITCHNGWTVSRNTTVHLNCT